jgi:hypothetical protein
MVRSVVWAEAVSLVQQITADNKINESTRMVFLSFFPELLVFEAVERQAPVGRVNPLKALAL